MVPRAFRVALLVAAFLAPSCSQPVAADIGTGYRKEYRATVVQGPQTPRMPRRALGTSRPRPRPVERASARPVPRSVAPVAVKVRAYPSKVCGGDLPPCRVMMRESRGDPRIWNGGCYAPKNWPNRSPCGRSSASGKWQFLRSTWAKHGGYLNAADAPVKVQDAKARAVWARGAGCGHWRACG